MTEQEYLDRLNKEPSVVKENGDKSLYVPISVVQSLLFELYGGNTRLELVRENFHSKGISGVGRLHYKHPVSGEWLFQDGSAAVPNQNGLRLDFPALAGHIICSCAKKIGKVFGRDLNREKEDAPIERWVYNNDEIGEAEKNKIIPTGLQEILKNK